MPYIDPHQRRDIDECVDEMYALLTRDGELNYAITRIVDRYLGPTPNYDGLNAAIGVLECAKLELYRRIVTPYEDAKLRLNGDAYGSRE